MPRKTLLSKLGNAARNCAIPVIAGAASLLFSETKAEAQVTLPEKPPLVYQSESLWRTQSPDFDLDKKIGLGDFFLFADAFDTRTPRYDLDQSGLVDFPDFFLFADDFGKDVKLEIPPEIILRVTPVEGNAPLSSRIFLDGTCQEGAEITNYSLVFPGGVIQKNEPIDTLLVFAHPQEFQLQGTVTDSRDLQDTETAFLSVLPALIPSADQTTTLENKVDVSYTADLTNAESATLEVQKDGETVTTQEITDDYTTQFTGLEKGDYAFIALDDTSHITIPDYPTEIDLSEVDPATLEIDEEASTTIDLEGKVTDPNAEDTPQLSAESTDGKTNVEVSDQTITITGNPRETGEYAVVISATNGLSTTQETITGELHDMLDLQGVLQDCEHHLPQTGTVKVFIPEGLGANDSTPYREIGSIDIGSGEFIQRIDQRIEELQANADHLLVQGQAESGTPDSYVRTIKLPLQDQEGLEVRVVSYDGFEEHNVTPEDFRRHLSEVMGEYVKGPAPNPEAMLRANPLIVKWDFGEDPNADYSFREVVIIKNNPNTTGTFNQETAEAIRQRILDPNDIGALFRGKIKNVRILEEDDWDEFAPEGTYYGRLTVLPKEGAAGKAFAIKDVTQDGYLDVTAFYIGVNDQGDLNGDPSTSVTLYHETGHASGLRGHAYTLTPSVREDYINVVTQMGNNRGKHQSQTPIADKRTADAIYEDSYTHQTGTSTNGMGVKGLGVRDIASLRFLESNESISEWQANPN